MSLRYVVSALLLFTAAAGWSFGPVTPNFDRGRFLPVACALFGVGTVIAGWHRGDEGELR